jgi:hypothetical protein
MRAVVRNVIVCSAWVLVATLVRPEIARADFATVTWENSTGDSGIGVGAPNPTKFSLNSDGTITVTATAFSGEIVDLFVNCPSSVWQNLTSSDWIGIPAGYEAVGQTSQYFGTFDGPSIQYNSSLSSTLLSSVSYTVTSPGAPFTSVLQLFSTNGNSSNSGSGTGYDGAGYDVEAIVKNPAGSPSEYAEYGGLVATMPVHLPAAAWLMLSGLGGVTAFARKKRPA